MAHDAAAGGIEGFDDVEIEIGVPPESKEGVFYCRCLGKVRRGCVSEGLN